MGERSGFPRRLPQGVLQGVACRRGLRRGGGAAARERPGGAGDHRGDAFQLGVVSPLGALRSGLALTEGLVSLMLICEIARGIVAALVL